MRIRFAYTAIQVKDMNRAVVFYKSVLNMEQVTRKKVKETNGELCLLRSGKNYLELNQYFGRSFRRGGALDHLAFEVGNLDDFTEKTEDMRIRVHDYLETKNWKRCFIDDPDGNEIEVYQRLEVRHIRSKMQ